MIVGGDLNTEHRNCQLIYKDLDGFVVIFQNLVLDNLIIKA